MIYLYMTDLLLKKHMILISIVSFGGWSSPFACVVVEGPWALYQNSFQVVEVKVAKEIVHFIFMEITVFHKGS
jgi:hypothetical protein